MQTYSHFLITAALYRIVPGSRRLPRKAVFWGSVTPDLPLIALSLGSFVYFRLILDWAPRDLFRHIYGTLFYTDPFWIVSHNTLQAPLVLLTALTVLWKIHGRLHMLSSPWFGFFLSCLFHATIDIFTHHNDGPLVFFPLDWTQRFFSPVSYWDRQYYGTQFSRVEHLLDLLIVAWFILPMVCRRFFGGKQPRSEAGSLVK